MRKKSNGLFLTFFAIIVMDFSLIMKEWKLNCNSMIVDGKKQLFLEVVDSGELEPQM